MKRLISLLLLITMGLALCACDSFTVTFEPNQFTTNETSSDGTVLDESTPEGTSPEETSPEETSPEVTTPEITTPEVTTPEVTTPEVTTPEVTTPEETTPIAPDKTVLTWDEFVAAEDDTPVVVKGVIGGIVETSKENDLYLQDENGGYFVYKLAVKPSEQGLKVGMTVRVSGIRDTYYGVNQITDAKVEILDATTKEVAPIDITQAFKGAENLKAASLTKYQSMFVTIKGATVLGQDSNNSTYFNFSLAGKQAYVRISSVTSMLTKDGEITFKNNVANHIGYSADITGFVSIYNSSIYIIPFNENAFSNFRVAGSTPAEQIIFEKDLLKDKVNTLITTAGTIDLVTAPQLYKDVTISWSVSENEYAKVENGKLIVSLPNKEVKVTLTATFTNGEVTDTASYEVTIAAAPTIIPQIVEKPAANTGYKYFLKQGNINQTLYFAGIMDGYYLATTTNPTEAVDVGFEPVEGKDGEYYLYFMDGTIKTYIVAYMGTKTDGSEVANLKLSIHQKEANVWTFNTEHNTPVTKLTVKNTEGKPVEDTYYIGAYNTFQTLSLSKISYLPSNTSFAAQFATLLNTSVISDADKVAAEKEALTIKTEIKEDCVIELPVFGSVFEQVRISWASNNEFAVINGNTLTVTQQKDVQTVTLTATITSGDITDTKKFTVTITAIPTAVPQIVEPPVAGTEYYFGLYQGNLNSLLFITGEMKGYYYETTDDIDAAIKVVLEAVPGKDGVFYLSTTVGGAKKYLNIVKSANGLHNNVVYDDTAISEYIYNTEYKTVTTVLGEETFFFGTYNTYNTFSASTIDKASGNFVAHFYKLVDAPETPDVPVAPDEPDTPDEPVVIDPPAESELTVEEAIALGSSKDHNTYTEGKYYVTGVVQEIKHPTYGNMYIVDESGNSIYVYGTYSADGSARYDAMDVKPVAGDTVTLYGVVGNYNGAQIKNAWLVAHTAATPEETTPGTPEETTPTPDTPAEPAPEAGTVTVVIADLADANGWVNATMYDTIQMNEYVTITCDATTIGSYGRNTGKYYENGENWRIYQNENPALTIAAAAGKTIVSVKITYIVSNTGILTLNGNNVESDALVEVNTNSITFSVGNTGGKSNGQVRITAIEVVYAEGGAPEPEVTTPEETTPDEPVVIDPPAESELTVEEAIALGASKEHNTYTEGKYYVTGVITEVYNTTYGNMKITDEYGNILTLYGTWSADGSARYDAMDVQPIAGDIITVYGIIGQYGGTPQIKNGWIVAHEATAPSVPEETTPIPDVPVDPDTPVALDSIGFQFILPIESYSYIFRAIIDADDGAYIDLESFFNLTLSPALFGDMTFDEVPEGINWYVDGKLAQASTPVFSGYIVSLKAANSDDTTPPTLPETPIAPDNIGFRFISSSSNKVTFRAIIDADDGTCVDLATFVESIIAPIMFGEGVTYEQSLAEGDWFVDDQSADAVTKLFSGSTVIFVEKDAPANPPEDDDGKTTIVFYHTMGATLQEVLDKYIAEFNQLYPDIIVEHKPVGGYDDVRDRIKTELTVGEHPNIAYCYPDHVALYNIAKAVQPLDDLIGSTNTVTRADGTVEQIGLTQEQIANFIDAFYNEGRAFGDGLMYTMPMSKSTEVLYYNKTFFEKHNIKVPTTWDEMEAVCEQLKAIDPDCIPLGYDSEANWFITMCEQYGSPYTSATGDHFLFDNETNRNFVARFREWYQKGYVTTQELTGSYTSSLFTMDPSERANCYMCIASSAGAYHYRSGFEVGIAPIPQVDPTNPKVISQGPSLCIFKDADEDEVLASWLFVKFLITNVDFQAEFSMNSGYMPVLESVVEHPVYADFLENANGHEGLLMQAIKVAFEQADAYFTSPAFVGSSEARDQVGILLQYCMCDNSAATAEGIKKAFERAIEECNYQIGN